MQNCYQYQLFQLEIQLKLRELDLIAETDNLQIKALRFGHNSHQLQNYLA